MKVGSLFSGIGGLDLGLERAGFEIAWQVEIDAYCQKVLAKHWPDTPRYGDVRDCGAHNLTPIDLICGGFPCQDISIAGRRAGITGEQSGLWSEFHRIICELRPRFILVENVAALLYGGIDRVLADLAESGYDAEWQIISAEAVGAPHLRERVFIVGYSMRLGCRRQGLQHNTGAVTGPRSQDGCEMADTQCQRCARITDPARRYNDDGQAARWQEGTSGIEQCSEDTLAHATSRREWQYIFTGRPQGAQPIIEQSSWWAVEPDVGRMAHGVPSRVDRLKGLGNAVVPQVAEYIGRCILEANP
jgi:DNA (cytosine-5)-methyltransferase 1